MKRIYKMNRAELNEYITRLAIKKINEDSIYNNGISQELNNTINTLQQYFKQQSNSCNNDDSIDVTFKFKFNSNKNRFIGQYFTKSSFTDNNDGAANINGKDVADDWIGFLYDKFWGLEEMNGWSRNLFFCGSLPCILYYRNDSNKFFVDIVTDQEEIETYRNNYLNESVSRKKVNKGMKRIKENIETNCDPQQVYKTYLVFDALDPNNIVTIGYCDTDDEVKELINRRKQETNGKCLCGSTRLNRRQTNIPFFAK